MCAVPRRGLSRVLLDRNTGLNCPEGDWKHLLAGRRLLMQYIKVPITRSKSATEPAARETVNANRPVSLGTSDTSSLQKGGAQPGSQ